MAGSERPASTFEASEHFFLRAQGVDEETRAAPLKVMECAHDSLTGRFGFERVSAVADKRIHPHLTVGAGENAALFTSPGSPSYSLIVFRGQEGDLRAFPRSGKHVVYGFCHELGHVLMGWEDSLHQWAHYIGSYLTSNVHAKLGARWSDPYDYHSLEGLPRFEREIAGVEPGCKEACAVARLFDEIGARFGQQVFGPACAWIVEHRAGKAFDAVELYRLEDLAAALLERGCDAKSVRELFGK